MRVRELMASILVTLCLLSAFNSIPILAPSPSLILLDSLVGNARGWDNAWTETIFGNGTPPFKTIVYSSPQVIWDGSQWVDYTFNSSDMSGGIGSVYVKFRTTYATIYDPNRTEVRIKDERWIAEWYDESTNRWKSEDSTRDEIDYVTNSSGIYFRRNSILESRSNLEVWYILKKGSKLKYSIKLTSATTRKYRIVWKLTGIMGIKGRLAMATEDIAAKKVITNTNASWIQFLDNLNNTKSSLSWTEAFWFNETTEEFETHFQGLELDVDPSPNHVQAKIWFGNYTLSNGESACLDPTTETFNSEAARDGHISKFGLSHPPAQSTSVVTGGDVITVGQFCLNVGGGTYYFYQYRGYVSFNTSLIPLSANIISVKLKLKTMLDDSDTDFMIKVMGGAQPLYGDSLDESDWELPGAFEIATWNTTDYPGDGVYINLTIPSDQVKEGGLTQFQLKSNREVYEPDGWECVRFYSGDSTGDAPKLEITWIPFTEYIDGQWWYYWNSTTNEKAAIVLFGGEGWSSYVRVMSLYIQDPVAPKENFVLDLHSNGYDVLSPKNDTYLEEKSEYDGTQDWVKNASIWLKEKGYQYIFLFGFSAGGVVVAYEIQKDYAALHYAAAVVASAPVDWDDGYHTGIIYHSADTADQVKVCTSFIEGITDAFYTQMSTYFSNINIHKEWHDWDNGHDVFLYTCLTHPDPPETVLDVAYNWYQHRHLLTVLAEDQDGNNLTTGDVYIDDQLVGYTGSTFAELGNHTVFVNDFWETGNTGFRYWFDNWEEGSGEPRRNITITEDTTITAIFYKKECPGDANGDCKTRVDDIYFVADLFGSNRGDSDWDSRADLNCDSKIRVDDVLLVASNFGETCEGYPCEE